MDTFNQPVRKENGQNRSSQVGEAASDLLNDGKKLAHELYAEGLNRVSDIEENVKEYSDVLLSKVRQNPLTSVLVAVGAGVLLSALFKK